MTNEELNRAVALARGWKPSENGKVWLMPTGDPKQPYVFAGWAIVAPETEEEAGGPFYHFGGTEVWDVCHSPAAWGALYEELRADEWQIEVTSGKVLTTVRMARWLSGPKKESGEGVDPGTGRALAKAFLKAKSGS